MFTGNVKFNPKLGYLTSPSQYIVFTLMDAIFLIFFLFYPLVTSSSLNVHFGLTFLCNRQYSLVLFDPFECVWPVFLKQQVVTGKLLESQHSLVSAVIHPQMETLWTLTEVIAKLHILWICILVGPFENIWGLRDIIGEGKAKTVSYLLSSIKLLFLGCRYSIYIIIYLHICVWEHLQKLK